MVKRAFSRRDWAARWEATTPGRVGPAVRSTADHRFYWLSPSALRLPHYLEDRPSVDMAVSCLPVGVWVSDFPEGLGPSFSDSSDGAETAGLPGLLSQGSATSLLPVRATTVSSVASFHFSFSSTYFFALAFGKAGLASNMSVSVGSL